MSRAIILAAGKGERLVHGFDFPKPLKRVADVPLIVRVIRNLQLAGIREVAVVVGYMADTLKQGLRKYRFDLDIEFVQNDEWNKPNGTSLLKAKHVVQGPTYLLMSDHLWSPDLIHAVGSFALGDDESVLGIDFNIARCLDLEDATKVKIDASTCSITHIGKELTDYDALDTGVFRITPALIEALQQVDGAEGCSLSQGVGALARRGKMRVANVGDAMWIDVDTPHTHAAAEKLIALYGDALRPATTEWAATQVIAKAACAG
jgi:choline kinase